MARIGTPKIRASRSNGINKNVVMPNITESNTPNSFSPKLISIIMPRNFINFSIFSLSILSSFLVSIIHETQIYSSRI